tara:strand:- start:3693 stop:3914 length:222 start_codon:yes stop_codon:yes gene_type:complete
MRAVMLLIDFILGHPTILKKPIVELLPFKEYHFSIGLGMRDISRSGQLVQIAPGNSGIVTGLLKGEHLFVGYH